jgi:hypothetical protein
MPSLADIPDEIRATEDKEVVKGWLADLPLNSSTKLELLYLWSKERRITLSHDDINEIKLK